MPTAEHVSVEHTEAYQALMQLAHRKTGSIPADLLVRHVLSLDSEGDWPLQRGALEGLVRRRGFARRDKLQVSTRPGRHQSFGLWETRRQLGKGRSRAASGDPAKRPYRTLLWSVDPIGGSCDCPDFGRGGLGLCKHLLVVLEELASKPKLWSRALKQSGDATQRGLSGPRLCWDPVRPLRGVGDWLTRVGWMDPPAAGSETPRLGITGEEARAWFEPSESDDADETEAPPSAPWRLHDSYVDQPAARLELVEDLLKFLRFESRRGARKKGRPQAAPFPSDPALAPLLADELARLQRANDLALVRRRPKTSLRGFKRQLYPYQQEGLARFLQSGRLLLADDMGLGKTAQAIAACHVLISQGLVKRGLVVVPAALKSQWEREWQAFTSIPVTVVDGPPEERAAIYRKTRQGYLIVNYEQVLRDLALMNRFGADLIVLDEAQRIKNWATKTATFVKQLQPKYRLVLTGTPLENRLDELASIMDWVDDHALEPKWRLTPWHAVYADGTQSVKGARNLDTLRTRIAPVTVRRLRREVLDQLPPRTDTEIPVPLTAAQRAEHDEFSQPIVQLMRIAAKRPLSPKQFLRLMGMLTNQRIICNGLAQYQFSELWPTLGGGGSSRGRRQGRGRKHQEAMATPTTSLLERLDSPKLSEFRELVSHAVIEQGRKVVVFSQWRRMLQLTHWCISDLLENSGRRGVFFTGGEGQKRRTQNLVDFHDDPATALLFCSDAGGVGLNLQRAANCLINLDLPWNPAVLEQRIGRIYRLGQDHPIDVYHLVSEGGIEQRIGSLIADKRALFTGLFDGESDEVMFESSGSFLEQIKRITEPVEVPDLTQADVDLEDDDDELDEVELIAGGPAGATYDVDATVDSVHGGATIASDAEPPDKARPDAAADPGAASTTPAGSTGSVSPEQLRGLMGQLDVRPTKQGGIVIEAPPEAAATLATLFASMADLLSAAAPPDEDA